MKKFILGKDGNSFVNVEHLQAGYVREDSEMNEDGYFVPNGSFSVYARIRDREEDISLATFDGDDADENLRAAQAYLAELVVKLNGGAQYEKSNLADS